MTATRQDRPGEARLRLFVEARLDTGRSLGLTAAQAHYVGNVMRLGAGARVLVFNGRDGEWRARIDGVGKGWCSLAVEAAIRPQAEESDLWLVFSPLKRARLDFLAQHATELGVSALWPVFTRRTAVRRINLARLAANAVEAAEQSRRLTVPEVFAPVPLPAMLARWPEGRRLFLCDESGAAPPVAEVFAATTTAAAAMLIGPEGGFAAEELDGLRKLPFVSAVGLGPRILRAETAAMAAIACWQALAGAWRG